MGEPTLVFTGAVKGKSGAGVDIEIEGHLEPTTKTGTFLWADLTGGQAKTLKIDRAKVKKENINSKIADIEVHVNNSYRQKGYKFPQIERVSDTRLDVEFIPGLTLLEELCYTPNIMPKEIVDRLKTKYHRSRELNAQLPKILTSEQKKYLLRKEFNDTINTGISREYYRKYPLTSKLRVKMKSEEFALSADAYRVFELIEELIRPVSHKLKGWSGDSYGENFIEKYKIDCNGYSFGIIDAAKVIDTPYLLSDTFWLQRLHPENRIKYRQIETEKAKIFREFAAEKGLNGEDAFLAYNAARFFSNTFLYLHNYHDMKEKINDASKGNNIAQYKVFQHLSQLFAHYEMNDTGLNSFMSNYDPENISMTRAPDMSETAAPRIDYNGSDSRIIELQQLIPKYKTEMDQLTRNLVLSAGLIPNGEFLGQCYRSFNAVRSDYRNFKNNFAEFKLSGIEDRSI